MTGTRMRVMWVGLLVGGLATGGANAAVVSYTVAQLQAMTVNAPLTGYTPGTLIAGVNLGGTSPVGSSLQNGNGYTWPNDKPRGVAASLADNRWIQTGNTEIWDLGTGYSRVAVSNAYDHDRGRAVTDPVLWLESQEWTAWGSNSSAAAFGGAGSPGTWELGLLSKIYAQGWDTTPGALYDDYLGVVSFSQAYRYIHVVAQNSISIQGHTSGDNEIDWVGGVNATVPAPSAIGLVGVGLAALARRRRHAA